jgi:hypothetical protein
MLADLVRRGVVTPALLPPGRRPAPVRTLDALHLAAVDYLVRAGQHVAVATCDERMRSAAGAMGFELYPSL